MRPPASLTRSGGFWAVLFCVTATVTARGSSCRSQERLDLSALYDGNVFESVSGARGDAAALLGAHLQSRCAASRGFSLSLEYNGGLEVYRRYSTESRTIHDFQLGCARRLTPSLSAGLSCQGRAKMFFHAGRGHTLFRAWPSLSWTASPRLTGRVFLLLSRLNDAQGSEFDYRQAGAGVSLERSLADRLSATVQYTVSSFRFSRTALDYRPADPEPGTWVDLGVAQEDTRQEVVTSLELFRGALLHWDLSYTAHQSNRYGDAYRAFRLQFLAAKPLPWRLTTRLYWTVLLKKYTDSLRPVLQVQPDSESEESSYVLTDLSRDLRPQTSLRIRLGYYRNESVFRDHYYEKVVSSAGITERF